MDIVPYLTASQIETLLHGLTLVAGGIAFAFGLWQYSKTQAWKRYEFVANEARQFYADPQVRNAMQMIDWGTREIELFPSHPDYTSRFAAILNEYVVFYHFRGVTTLFQRYGWQFGTGATLQALDRQKIEDKYDNVYEGSAPTL